MFRSASVPAMDSRPEQDGGAPVRSISKNDMLKNLLGNLGTKKLSISREQLTKKSPSPPQRTDDAMLSMLKIRRQSTGLERGNSLKKLNNRIKNIK